MARVARIVVLANGAAGAEKQALALADRLQENLLRRSPTRGRVPIARVDAAVRGIARALPPPAHVLAALAARSPSLGYDRGAVEALQALLAPSGDGDQRSVVIGCGRSTVALSALLKRASPSRVVNVQIQHPRAPLAWFDAVVAPRHDFRAAAAAAVPRNVLLTAGTVHGVTPAALARHLSRWRARLDALVCGRPTRVAWLVGGPCRGFAFSEAQAAAMAAQVAAAVAASGDQGGGGQGDGAALLVSFSRRTPRPVRERVRRELARRLPARGQLAVWDGAEAANPFLALLATAAAVLTTPDSVSMTTEAVAAGRPVLTLQAEQCRGKFARFHDGLRAAGWTRAFDAHALADALRRGPRDPAAAAAREALERELAAVVDAVADMAERGEAVRGASD